MFKLEIESVYLDGTKYTTTYNLKTLSECENVINLLMDDHFRPSYVQFNLYKKTSKYQTLLFAFDNSTHVWTNYKTKRMGTKYTH